jgi:hypothetical protein
MIIIIITTVTTTFPDTSSNPTPTSPKLRPHKSSSAARCGVVRPGLLFFSPVDSRSDIGIGIGIGLGLGVTLRPRYVRHRDAGWAEMRNPALRQLGHPRLEVCQRRRVSLEEVGRFAVSKVPVSFF